MSTHKALRKQKGQQEHFYNEAKHPQIHTYLHSIKFKAPTDFSIVNNPEESISFYNKILYKRDENKIGTHFAIDSSAVKNVTVDAIMYLIAIISAAKYNEVHRYTFSGNFPDDTKAKEIYIECGFLFFVKANKNQVYRGKTDKIKILKGNDVNTEIAELICGFTDQYCKMTPEEMGNFYPVLIELMSNTRQHAYKHDNSKIPRYWYIFAERKDDAVQFVFLDTGIGIPKTVHKEIVEKLMKNLFNLKNDSEFIKSTLDGSFRTETKKENRGQGLPQISECFKSGLFRDVFVYSGSGACILSYNNTEEYTTKDFLNETFGTLFCWQIKTREGE